MVGNRKEGLDAGKDGWTGTNGTAKTATIRAGSRVMAHTLHVEVWHLRGPNFFSQRIGKGHLRFGSMRGGVWYEAWDFSNYMFIFSSLQVSWMNENFHNKRHETIICYKGRLRLYYTYVNVNHKQITLFSEDQTSNQQRYQR